MIRLWFITPILSFLAVAASPLPVVQASIQTGDLVRIGNGPGSPGGIFYLKDTSGNKIADTFCVDLFENVRFDRIYKVANAFATETVAGGYDLTPFAAWLYDRYLNGVAGVGAALPNFDFSIVYNSSAAARIQANELQLAIWEAMGYTPAEIGGVGSGWYSTYSGKVAGWHSAFLSDATWSGTGDIYMLNLLRQDASGNYTLNAQDQLVRHPSNIIPEPLSVAVWAMLACCAIGVTQLRRS